LTAERHIPFSEKVWHDLTEMLSEGQTYADLLADMIDERKKRRSEEDVKMWESRPDSEFVPLSEIKD